MALGAALSGMRPIHTHLRSDFMLLGMDQIVNCVARSGGAHMTHGQVKVPLVIRAVIGRGWGYGAGTPRAAPWPIRPHSLGTQGIR